MNNPYASGDFTANNPFVSDPHSRYPDLHGSPAQDPSATQFTQWLQPGAQSPMGQQPPFQQQQFQQQVSPQFSPGYIPQQGFAAPQSPSQFQPTSSFGQQLAGQVNGSSYGYLQGQNTAAAPVYNPVQQQFQNNPGYIAQFDPYASIGQGWDGQMAASQQQQQQQQQQPSNSAQNPASPGAFSTSTSATGQLHPREYIRIHKAEVESWDAYAWKQLLQGFDALKDAWEARKKELEGHVAQLQQQVQQYGGYYAGQMQQMQQIQQMQQEAARLQGMVKESESNFDSITASSFQMHEVFANYRQSGDLASKRRVREASNAAITSLPDWPPLAY
ncbi:hypothetical protein C8R44DRAFT_780175 [Mycena epipterygia]|nr:hypothetical protein C8R44DRAFT_780175 [Mycena epipterygia]